MNSSIISFTKKGLEQAKRIASCLGTEETRLFTKCGSLKEEENVCYVEESVSIWAGEQIKEKRNLIFVGSCGIAVRSVALFLTNKLHDPAVLAADEEGRFVIPLVSGHVGGGNALAVSLAKGMGAIPVITTATDLQKKFAVDLFAKKNNLYIENKEGIAQVSSKVLAGKTVTMAVEAGHWKEDEPLPKEVRMVSYPPKEKVDILITSDLGEQRGILCLRPRRYVAGVGCKKGVPLERINNYVKDCLEEMGVFPWELLAVTSIDRKKEEQGLVDYCRKAGIFFWTFTAEELMAVPGVFHGSAFVSANVGADNVCERAAVKGCGKGGQLIMEKKAKDGMTLALARREWSVTYDGA